MRKQFKTVEEEIEYYREVKAKKAERDRQYYYTVTKRNEVRLKQIRERSKQHYETKTKLNPAKMRDRRINSKKYYHEHVKQKRKSHVDITQEDLVA